MSKSITHYDIIIGLEVHAQLATKTKIFCSCPTTFGQEPNTQVCVVCAGMPGVLPVLNKQVFWLGMRAVQALGGSISSTVKFDRKNYFYPDLPKGYQISQFDNPLGKGGVIDIVVDDVPKAINITRLHLEEDAGKLLHVDDKGYSLVDLNRAGVPLAEIVSEPEMKTPDEAYAYLTNLKAILKSTGACDADMEKGQLRCDANISLRKSTSDPFGAKVEIKNLNSFKYIRSALYYEIERQTKALDAGEVIPQETRLWDQATQKTYPMRSKEDAHDYRYFPEPDLVPFKVDPKWIEEIKTTMPELPSQKLERFMKDYELSEYDARALVSDDSLEHLFEGMAKKFNDYKVLINWIMGPLSAHLNEEKISLEQANLNHQGFIDMLNLVKDKKISYKACKEEVFPVFMKTQESPESIMQKKGLAQISDSSELESILDGVIEENPKSVEDFKSGKGNALMFLVGQVMRKTKGKANPNLVNQMLSEKLK